MNVSELDRPALETTYKLIRLRLFKADAKNDFAIRCLEFINEKEEPELKDAMIKDLLNTLKNPKVDFNEVGAIIPDEPKPLT